MNLIGLHLPYYLQCPLIIQMLMSQRNIVYFQHMVECLWSANTSFLCITFMLYKSVVANNTPEQRALLRVE